MPAQILSQASSFNTGAELWIVPERKNCALSARLDWHLNFQIAKSSQHVSRQLSSSLLEILNHCDLKEYDFKEDQACLMISSQHLVPANWVLVVKDSHLFEKWVQIIFEKWQGLAYPSLRVFLPKGQSPTQFESLWAAAGGSDQISLVVDSNG